MMQQLLLLFPEYAYPVKHYSFFKSNNMSRVLLIAALIALSVSSCTTSNVVPSGTNTNSSTTDDNPNNSNGNGDDNPNNSNGNGDDNKKAQVGFELAMTNKSNSLGKSTAGTLAFTGGTVNPKLVKFEAEQNNSEIEYKVTNTGEIDLLSLVTFGNITLPAGTYNEIELKVELVANGSTPAIELNGTFNDGSGNVPVTFVANEGLEIKTEQNNVTLAQNSTFTAEISLDMATFVSGISSSMLENAQVTNGTIVISASSNTTLYNLIVNNLKSHHHHCAFHH